MQLASFDIYAVFGEWDCRMQTTFLQKFPLHMTLIPIMLFCVLFAYLIAVFNLKCCCTQRCRSKIAPNKFGEYEIGKYIAKKCIPLYTEESARIKAMYIIQFFFFNLYT